MKTTITKKFEFESAHSLPDSLIYGKCRFLHGHTYKLEVEITGEIKEDGMIMNFTKLKEIVNSEVINKLDHNNINRFVEISTAENILKWIYEQINSKILETGNNINSLTLYETSNSFAKLIL